MMIEICEIFYSLQGESSYSGKPCIFIRLSGCNLRCSYCDTQYSYAPGTMMSVESILQTISEFPARLVELTGGEPLWQEESIALMEALLQRDYTVLLETNGSLWIEDVPQAVVKILDVKTPGSGCGDSFMKWNLKQLSEQDELKFVLTSHEDYRFALDFIKEHKLEGRIIHFSPVTSVLPAETLAQWMLADAAPARLSLQLHKILSLR